MYLARRTLVTIRRQISVTWIKPSGENVVTTGSPGADLLQLAHANGIELEGACEGSCACSTCHVILADSVYDALPEPSEEEDDLLDLAYGLTPTSRLGCQVKLTEILDNATIKLPQATRNLYVDKS